MATSDDPSNEQRRITSLCMQERTALWGVVSPEGPSRFQGAWPALDTGVLHIRAVENHADRGWLSSEITVQGSPLWTRHRQSHGGFSAPRYFQECWVGTRSPSLSPIQLVLDQVDEKALGLSLEVGKVSPDMRALRSISTEQGNAEVTSTWEGRNGVRGASDMPRRSMPTPWIGMAG